MHVTRSLAYFELGRLPGKFPEVIIRYFIYLCKKNWVTDTGFCQRCPCCSCPNGTECLTSPHKTGMFKRYNIEPRFSQDSVWDASNRCTVLFKTKSLTILWGLYWSGFWFFFTVWKHCYVLYSPMNCLWACCSFRDCKGYWDEDEGLYRM